MNFPRGRGDQKTKHGISGGWGEYGETLWNGKSWGVGGSNWKNPPWGGYGYFLEPHNWRARCKNGLSDNFGPPFTKPPNYLLSCNVTVAKWIVSCSQHIILVIWVEFPPNLYQVTLLLARKEKLPKCQEIPIISAGAKKQFCCCPWWIWL